MRVKFPRADGKKGMDWAALGNWAKKDMAAAQDAKAAESDSDTDHSGYAVAGADGRLYPDIVLTPQMQAYINQD